MLRSASDGNLLRPRVTASDSSDLSGKDVCGSGREASGSAKEGSAVAPNRMGLESSAMKAVCGGASSARVLSQPAALPGAGPQASSLGGLGPAAALQDMEEREGRSEDAEHGRVRLCATSGGEQQLEEKMDGVEGDGYLSDNGGGHGRTCSKERKKGVAWTEEEHRLFLIGLSKLGKGDWRGIARNYVLTRTPTQVASHAQKYFIRQNNLNKRKRRASLLDISEDAVPSDPGMMRSLSSPALPSLAEDAQYRPVSLVEKTHPPSSTSTSLTRQAPPPSPACARVNIKASKSLEQLQFNVADAMTSLGHSPPFPAPFYPHSSPYGQHFASNADPMVYYSGYKLPVMDFSRSQSYPTVALPGVPGNGSSLSRPSSMPTLASSAPMGSIVDGGGRGGSAVDGVWQRPGVVDPPAPHWSRMFDSSRPPDPQALASMDPAIKHRLGHEMMMAMVNRQFGQRMAADYSRAQAGAYAVPADMAVERRSKWARTAGTGPVVDIPHGDINRSMGSLYVGSSSPFSAPLSFASSLPAAADPAAAAAGVAALGAGGSYNPVPTYNTLQPTSPLQSPLMPSASPSWYLPSYNTWRPPAVPGMYPPAPSAMPPYAWQSALQPPLPQGGALGSAPEAIKVHRPTPVFSTAPISIPELGRTTAGSAVPGVPEQEPVSAFATLSKCKHNSQTKKASDGLGRGASLAAQGGTQRKVPATLELFDVAERPSAFHPQQCPASSRSPDSGDVAKSPISVP